MQPEKLSPPLLSTSPSPVSSLLKMSAKWPVCRRVQVVFVGIKEGSALQRVNDLAIKLETSLQAAGLSSSSKKVFRPHLTLMKLSKDFTLRRKACNVVLISFGISTLGFDRHLRCWMLKVGKILP
uniref:Uncharacterized protein n=1 Tax=Timema cristinae TaxID=61476 RepID=A0A7R9DPP3_TIMCR|nr:unnamed protein product [Timema cristinae]